MKKLTRGDIMALEILRMNSERPGSIKAELLEIIESYVAREFTPELVVKGMTQEEYEEWKTKT